MQQIAEWLERLGMSEHAQRFAEHGIGIAALPHLTDQDLKDIGVLLGHRRIMLAAIAKLDRGPTEGASTPPAATPIALEPASLPIGPAAEVARRAALSHGHVLRPRRFDQHFSAARRRRMARPGRSLS